MGDAHESYLVRVLRGRRTRASGAVWSDQMDGRHSRFDQSFAFAWDGKSTLGKSISVSRVMWNKAVDQAGGERPILPLRFYDNESLEVGIDLVVMDLNDFIEMMERANGGAE